MLSVTCFWALSISVLTGFIHGQSIIDGPDDATGQIGGTAHFHCTVEFGVFQEMTWEFNDKIIYSFIDDDVEYPMGSSKYNVIKYSNRFTLKVSHLNYTDGGQYTCVAFLPTANAVLVVLGKPIITVYPSQPVEGQSVNLTCVAQFGGPPKDSISPKHYPELLMYLDGKLLDIPTTENQNQLSKTLIVVAEAGMNGQELSCLVRTSNAEMSTVSNDMKLEILYSVRNARHSLNEDNLEVGSSIKCSASGNPHPILEWINEEDPAQFIQGQWLNATKAMIGMNKWKCTARNYVKGVMYHDSVMASFEVAAKAEGVSNTVVFVIIGLLVGLSLLCVGIFLYVKKKRKNRYKVEKDGAGDQSSFKFEAAPLISNEEENRTGKVQTGDQSNSEKDPILLTKYVSDSKEEPLAKPIQGNEVAAVPQRREDVKNLPKEAKADVQLKCLKSEYQGVEEDEAEPQKSEDVKNQPKKVEAGAQSRQMKPQLQGYEEFKSETLVNVDVKNQNKVEAGAQSRHMKPQLQGYEEVKSETLVNVDVKNQNKKTEAEDKSNLFKSENVLDSKDKPWSEHYQGVEKAEEVALITTCVDNQPKKEEEGAQSKHLMDLISQVEVWSEDLISQVKELLQNGADPTWISPKDCQEDRSKNITVQYKFFSAIIHILLFRGELFNQIKSLVPLFMSIKSNNSKFIRGNALHALVDVDWKWLTEQSIPDDFFQHYQDIILTVKKTDSSLINVTDWNGRTPLHLLFEGVQLQEEWLEYFTQIVQKLRSDENVNIVDHHGRTVLHDLTEALPIFQKDLSIEGRRNFLIILTKLISDYNVSFKDEYEQTALDILEKKLKGVVPGPTKDFLCEIRKKMCKKQTDGQRVSYC